MIKYRVGDHIKVNRWYYSHHGIVSEVDEGSCVRVIHYAKNPNNSMVGKIQEQEFEHFIGNSSEEDITIVNHEGTFSVHKLMCRARSAIGTADYSLLGSNCEHFAAWVHTDLAHSTQVENTGQSLLYTGVGIAAMGLAAIAASLFVANKATNSNRRFGN